MQKFIVALRAGTIVSALALAATAQAGLTGNPLTITATNANGSAIHTFAEIDGSWSNNNTVWTLNGLPGQIIEMRDTTNNQLIAELEMTNFAVQFVFDPQIDLNFGVVAGAADTNFHIASALLSFPAIFGATAEANASVTVTDRFNNGATYTGLHGGNGYRADYNGLVPGGTNFGTLVSTYAFTGGTLTNGGSIGTTPVGGSISDMSAVWDFTLSARDSAQGTSSYIIVPAPGAAAIGLLGLGLVGRRRR